MLCFSYLKVVTPLNPAKWRDGVQRFHKYLRTLDSGFRRNDEKKVFSTCYETVKVGSDSIPESGWAGVYEVLCREPGREGIQDGL